MAQVTTLLLACAALGRTGAGHGSRRQRNRTWEVNHSHFQAVAMTAQDHDPFPRHCFPPHRGALAAEAAQ